MTYHHRSPRHPRGKRAFPPPRLGPPVAREMTMLRRDVPALLLVLLAAGPSRAEVKLNHLFADHMVLQQGAAVPVWGTAGPGERVTVGLGTQSQTATAGDDGKWMV